MVVMKNLITFDAVDTETDHLPVDKEWREFETDQVEMIIWGIIFRSLHEASACADSMAS